MRLCHFLCPGKSATGKTLALFGCSDFERRRRFMSWQKRNWQDIGAVRLGVGCRAGVGDTHLGFSVCLASAQGRPAVVCFPGRRATDVRLLGLKDCDYVELRRRKALAASSPGAGRPSKHTTTGRPFQNPAAVPVGIRSCAGVGPGAHPMHLRELKRKHRGTTWGSVLRVNETGLDLTACVRARLKMSAAGGPEA